MKPEAIESLSFSIIDTEAGSHDFSPEQWNIVRRMIHTSADFEYMRTVRFHPEALSAGLKAIREGKAIITDTEMARSGIRKADAARFGMSVSCLIGDEKVRELAQKSGETRAKAAVDAALPLMKGGIYVIGNAPTALLRILELIKEGKAEPALIVGLPVGFVNAAESKAELIQTDIPFISNTGRKGGSNLAAAVVNALLIMASEK
ncbi:MAG: precorrin-8X methylmutase [Desulfococcaceae bacterium]|jgi:precorrin-8X/cobalt-precorrin-8 methylmutase|nr:precorrin-8X methylmutase [Desulfococcaceae bacterium]